MTISLIAACDLNLAIGNNNQLLCDLPNDLRHFKNLTQNNFICMGRKTYDSIGHPLPNRHNIILTRDKEYIAPTGTFVYNSVEEVISLYNKQNHNESELYFIGGSEIYYQALPYCDKIYLTIINNKFEEVDVYFPSISLDEWKTVENQENKSDEKNPYDHYFVTYERKINNK